MTRCLGILSAALCVLVSLACWGVGATSRARAAVLWPLPGALIAEFDPPDPDWLPGHRGIDLVAAPGEQIRSPRSGTIEFAGSVGGTPVVVVAHGVLRATYLPATPLSPLEAGHAVSAGQAIAEVADDGTHCPRACLHWGARAHERYVDPRLLLGHASVVLTPLAD